MKNNQEKNLALIKDLGSLFPTEKSKYRARYALYRCYCGKEFKSQVAAVKNKSTVSCGCYNLLKAKERCTTHGFKNHRLYPTWNGMMQRCNNPKSNSYKNYGRRGISICDRWLNIANFIEDVYPTFIDGLTLDRKNPNGNYEPSNCRWATKSLQQRNKRIVQSNNTSGYKGVSWHKRNNLWTSCIRNENKQVNIGSFKTAIEAAKAYDQYVIDNNLEHTINGVLA